MLQWEKKRRLRTSVQREENEFALYGIEKLSLRVLKKQLHILEPTCENINIDALIQRFEKVCLFDSNKSRKDPKYLNTSKILAVGSTQEFHTTSTKGILSELQKFCDVQKGWIIGCLSYDLKNSIEDLSSENKDRQEFPALYFFCPKVVLVIENNSVTVTYDEQFTSALEADEIFGTAFLETTEKSRQQQPLEIKAAMTREAYLRSVTELKGHIRNGNIYEVNFCQEFYAENASLDTVATYQKLNAVSAAPFSAYCKLHTHYLLCASPERFLQKSGDKLISQPIKGTIRRSNDKSEDEALKRILQSDAKERSENVMIVDLVRNDLSRIAKRGTVEVEELFGIYSFKQVHQMISTISCELDPKTRFTDILRATFPMGSMTGAPKISAMKLIEEFETTKRGLYSGAVGYIDPDGNFDFNVVIRSILYNSEKKYVSFMAGSAITDKSDPEKEYDECMLKAKAMFEVLGGDPPN